MEVDVGTVLIHILVVLVAAKLAAEVAERAGIPAVVGEIVAGVLIGPSVLDLVGTDDVLRTLGQIGVILLLLEVGMEMDLGELGRVGRASMLVATVGVVAPMALGMGAMGLIGQDFNTALFVGAALTATSVGITARVFGDLRALATTEARIVLGAAVADDVIGLVVLTVVVRIVTEGSVSVLSVAGIVAVAVGFLVVGGVVGLRVAPPLFAAVERLSRTRGTLVAIALAFALAAASAADAAKLAPIVGAFVAGLALVRSRQSDHIRRELAPVGHLFIPVFFLQIGIDADVSSFADATVLRDAAVLLAVAIAGKLVSPLGATGTPADKVLIGLGMLPRGEVGLIFATIGLQSGVLGADLYAALLLVVLVTTLVTPQLLTIRYRRLRASASLLPATGEPEPAGGWLEIVDGEVRLRGRPPAHAALPIALDAARLVAEARPSAASLDWLSSVGDEAFVWSPRATRSFLAVLTAGNARSWRFLDTLGVLERALPELAAALRTRRADPFELDPTRVHRWATLERLLEETGRHPFADEWAQLAHPQRLVLAAFLVDVVGEREDGVAVARRLVGRLDLGAAAEEEVADLIESLPVVRSVARRFETLGEERLLQLAAHLGTAETARAAYLLAAAATTDDELDESRLASLHGMLQALLATPTLSGREARNLVNRRRAAAARLAGDDIRVRARIDDAPRPYVMAEPSSALARQAALVAGREGRRTVASVHPAGDGSWFVDIASHDRPGLLAAAAGALHEAGLNVVRAVVATWPDGAALEAFTVVGPEPDPARLAAAVESGTGALRGAAVPDAVVTFDDGVSPWQTVCEVRATDRPGLLHAITTALAAAGLDVHGARISSEGGMAVDHFDLTDRRGAKLDEAFRTALRWYLASGVAPPRRWWTRFSRASGNGHAGATPGAHGRNVPAVPS